MIPRFPSPYANIPMEGPFDEWKDKVGAMTRSEQVQELSDRLSNMLLGGGDYGVYTKTHEVQRMNHLLHVLLD